MREETGQAFGDYMKFLVHEEFSEILSNFVLWMRKSANLEMESFHDRNGTSKSLKIKILTEFSGKLLRSKRHTFLTVVLEK